MRTAGDNDAYAVPALEAICRGPKFYAAPSTAASSGPVRTQAAVAVANVRGTAVRRNIAQAQIQIGVLCIRAQEDIGRNRPYGVQVSPDRLGRKNQDIRAAFQFGHIARAFP